MSVPQSQDLCLSKRRYLLCSYDWLPESGRCSRRPYNIYLNRRRLWWKLPEKVAALFAYLKYVIRIHCHWITVVQTHLRYLCIQMIAWWTVYSWAFIVVLHNITECLCSLRLVFAERDQNAPKPTHCFSYVSSLSISLNASRNSQLKIIVLKPIVKGNQPKPRYSSINTVCHQTCRPLLRWAVNSLLYSILVHPFHYVVQYNVSSTRLQCIGSFRN